MTNEEVKAIVLKHLHELVPDTADREIPDGILLDQLGADSLDLVELVVRSRVRGAHRRSGGAVDRTTGGQVPVDPPETGGRGRPREAGRPRGGRCAHGGG